MKIKNNWDVYKRQVLEDSDDGNNESRIEIMIILLMNYFLVTNASVNNTSEMIENMNESEDCMLWKKKIYFLKE